MGAKLDSETGEIRFSSMTKFDPCFGMIGLSHELNLVSGYDDTHDFEAKKTWSKQDREELAELMIERWKQFSAKEV